MNRVRVLLPAGALLGVLLLSPGLGGAQPRKTPKAAPVDLESLRLAVGDLTETFGPRYPRGREYLRRLSELQEAARVGDKAVGEKLRRLRREALLANPLLGFEHLLLVRRRIKTPRDPGFPSNHECNSSLKRTGHDNEIAVLSPVGAGGKLRTLYRPTDGGYVGELDLHWDADRLLLAKSDRTNWKIWEAHLDGSAPASARPRLRQVSRTDDDVDSFDPCYLPDGRIVFGCTASYQSVPCWHGQKWVSNLYVMKADGSGVRQLCFDQDHNFHPVVLNDGRVLYHRWDYTGINHIFMRPLMVMNPDGTGQRAVYGSNSWFPNSLYFPRPIPLRRDLLVSVLSGYHGVHRMGRLVLIDTSRGWHGKEGIVHEVPRRGRPIQTAVRDNLVDRDWPKFLHPFPLVDRAVPASTGKYFLVSCWPGPKADWGIYLVDVFDNMVLLAEQPGYALLEPIPLLRRPRPPAVPDRIDPKHTDGVVYLHDVYAGPGLAGVPRGTVQRLRVLAYHFGYRGLAGPDKIGYGGPWEVMRILGTVPLEADGSAVFRVPANTPLAVQPLDAEGKAVQLMRSWFTVMPGETLSCVGCHERVGETPAQQLADALRRPRRIEPWYGPPRGFDFAREVQPVLDRYCLGCHAGKPGRPDLRPEDRVKGYKGLRLSGLGAERLHPKMKRDTGGVVRYTPAYEALIGYIRRVSIEDDVSLLVPGEYHADTSRLIQMLRKGHNGVRPDAESWDRLITWIDLNAPCHGTWGDVYPIPDGAHRRRMELRKRYGGPAEDPEAVAKIDRPPVQPVPPAPLPKPRPLRVPGWPFDARKAAADPKEMTLDLGQGVTMKLVRIPAGEFVMGDAAGEPDERPLTRAVIRRPFWLGACEVTNAQFRRFDPAHDCAYYARRHARSDDQGLPLNAPAQPVVRVSWRQATAFCEWLTARTGRRLGLPTEAQWEWACRAGSAAPLAYGDVNADFSRWANMADKSFGVGGKQVTGGVEHLVVEGAALSERRFDDKSVVTAPVGGYRPNAWGLHDMHGNAAEWTRTTYGPYPYRDEAPAAGPGRGRDRKVVRGGSFFDPPKRCRSAFRLGYPVWQRVFNVGFRVVCEARTMSSR